MTADLRALELNLDNEFIIAIAPHLAPIIHPVCQTAPIDEDHHYHQQVDRQ